MDLLYVIAKIILLLAMVIVLFLTVYIFWYKLYIIYNILNIIFTCDINKYIESFLEYYHHIHTFSNLKRLYLLFKSCSLIIKILLIIEILSLYLLVYRILNILFYIILNILFYIFF